jgi:hypothetical protein
MLVIFCILFLNYVSSFRMKTFAAGEYILKPIDYNFQKDIVIELWGAGGSVNHNEPGDTTSGGSGSYIKASISTDLEKFKIKVGRARNSTEICSGEDSYIYNNRINLTAGGGQGFCNSCSVKYDENMTCKLGGKIISVKGTDDVISVEGNTAGTTGSIFGADAPFGGKGGKPYSPIYGYTGNGSIPGGGGGPSIPPNPSYCNFTQGMGGDGMIIIYY